MAIAAELLSDQQADAPEAIQLETDGWVPWVAVSGSLGLLLSVYLRTPTPLFHVRASTSEQLWDAGLQVDQDCSAHDFLRSIERSHHQNTALPEALHTFWLCTDSIGNWITSSEGASSSVPGGGLESSAVPRQILCTVKESGGLLSLLLEISGESSQNTARFLSQMVHVTRQLLVATTDGRTLRDLDLICDMDRRDLQRWNQQPPSTIVSTVHEVFGQRMLESPGSQAVDSWDGGLTYEELDSLSSLLSSILLEAGVCSGDCIPLCFEKSLWTVVAMLGVLKSGCSFLLMDVSHPTSRLQTLSNEVKATVVLSSSTQKDRATNLASRVIVVSDLTLQAPARKERQQVEVSPSAVALVVFTSGSTGMPKGIQIEHQSICSSLLALAKLSGISSRTRYFQFSSYAFDAAYGEMLMTLISGGCICIPSDVDRLNNLAESICTLNANTILLTPTVVRLLSPSDVPCLTTLISGGERVTQDIVGVWGGILDLVVAYGPAETTVACVAKKALPVDDNAIRIGLPLNSRAWITLLDNPNKLAPIGAVGELVVEGPGVARNYINNHLDNTKLFLDVPPWAQDWDSSLTSMGRCYRTGDMAQLAENGEIIFVGRRDRQIKLHGQRIELEDIETRLQQHTRLPGAHIVLEVLDIHGTNTLVAFLHNSNIQDISERNPNGDTADMTEEMALEVEGLRARISEELPSYMWPAVWIPLKELPLSPSGKLDRRMLLRLGEDYYSNLRTGDGDDDGLSPIESALATIWRQILQLATRNLTPDANFFRLGGDSLRSMKLVTLANKEGYHLTMEKVFRNPSISGMAAAMQAVPAAAAAATDDESHLGIVPASSLPTKDESSKLWSLLEEYGLDQEQVAGIFPCTALQEGLFSLSLALPSLYTSQFVFDFSSAVDIQRFKTAWESAISAFPILRTTIVPSSSSLMQVVLRHPAEWTEVKQELTSFLAADKAVSFRPGQPLARHYHIQDPSSGQSHLVWTLHHAIFDGWSLESVVNHIRRDYYHHAETVRPTGSFEKFVQFCQDLNRGDSDLFWKEQLKDAPTPSFPNLPKAGHLAADGSCLRYTMPTPTAATLGITTTIMARASWALLLSEYEGSDDITFGNALHGRNSLPPELQDVVCPTVTTLPIRVKVDRTQTVNGFLDGLQEQFSTMISYEQFGLSQILAINQDVKNAASFRTLLIVQVADPEPLDEEYIRLEEVERSLHEYPLVLTLMPGESQIEIIATFDSAVISPPQVQRILEQFEQAFHELSTVARDTKVGNLDFASKADKSTMFRWNARSHKAFEVCVHEMIQEQVKRSPASPAIYSRQGSLDYAALDRLSDGLAGEMRRFGVKRGSIVGVLFEKSQWAPVSILAIIKAGGAFAPLSPTNPRARLEDIAREANINVVLCSPLQNKLFPNPPWQTIIVGDDTASSFLPDAEAQSRVATPDSLLYVLSTSGTTGTPKVFAVQHKSFATGAIARASLIRRGSDSRVLQFAPFVFDPSVEDILTTLMFGGCVCVPSDEDIMGDISAFMKTARVNFANITPSVAYTLKQDQLPDLEILLLSGESPDQALVDKWDGRVQLMNGYGPSECSVKCSINCHLSRNDPRNIGHSAGTSLWVVKPGNHNRLAPLGAVGELVIESPNLAKGYMNRPAATEEKFIISPPWLRDFRDGHEAPVYKTGDLVKYLEDGSIVYIGRADLQLKLHGQRLEGEEVRQRIQECLYDEQLQVIVDTARFEGQDSDVLVAYLAQKGEYRTSEVELDPALQQRLMAMKEQMIRQLGNVLPKYMIPSVFLAVSNIPVTANGKADRRALRARTLRQRLEPQLLLSGDNPIELPASEGEKLLHSLWQKLLGLDGELFGANAHFFELGGSSLMAIKLVAALRDLGHTLSAQHIFANPILSNMAAQMVYSKKTTTVGPSRFSLLGKIGRSVNELRESLATYNIEEHDVEDAYPCTRQQRLYMEEEMVSPGGTTFRHIVPLPENTDLIRLETALRRVVRANAFLRTRIIPLSSHLVQVVLTDDFVCRQVEIISSLVLEDRKVSWGFGQQLSRFSIVDGGVSQPRYLAWSSSHPVFDGWCRKLLLEDIDYTYYHNDLPPPRPQYNKFIDYVYELDTDEASSTLVKELENIQFWNYFTLDGTRIPRITHFLSLGIDFPATLPSGLSYATVLLTAWAIVAAHVEEHDHFLFNILLGGRDAGFTGIESLMGPTSTTAPLATNVNSELTFRRHVEIIQKRVGEAGSMQHSPELGDKLHRLLASAPILVVHPADDYVEAPTRYLGLVRSSAEMVHEAANAMFMNFLLRTGNAGVDLLLEIDPTFFPQDKATRYLCYMEQVL
ncbi:Nonribosomal peptide synthetase dtxS1 [Lachnellula cervina]|uniref:Nonribosomal peptide synthetase dtxS1 n=1 Tax=Lachnellula cervina TaxID=1316786 RepID=A0A7D8YVD9_9HELO|nr:Nonribosomal peptide synthetase dtxS1 [Lachnellula cervina]